VYMTVYFSGAALGSWLSSKVWDRWQWNGVCTMALGFMALAALRHATGVKDSTRRTKSAEDVVLQA
jgi:sugar phosphate permease